MLTYKQAESLALDCATRTSGDTVERLYAAELALRCVGHDWTFGVESVTVPEGAEDGRTLYYLNTGDTYAATICCEDGDEPVVCDWGSWVEDAERIYELMTATIRCGNCGAYTPIADNWSETICERCGRCVAGD